MRCDAQWAIPVDQEILQTNLKEVFLKKKLLKAQSNFQAQTANGTTTKCARRL